jgi:hypothetical protein
MVREISGAKINPYRPFKVKVPKIRRSGNYASKYGIYLIWESEKSEALSKFTDQFIHTQLSGEIFSI